MIILRQKIFGKYANPEATKAFFTKVRRTPQQLENKRFWLVDQLKNREHTAPDLYWARKGQLNLQNAGRGNNTPLVQAKFKFNQAKRNLNNAQRGKVNVSNTEFRNLQAERYNAKQNLATARSNWEYMRTMTGKQ